MEGRADDSELTPGVTEEGASSELSARPAEYTTVSCHCGKVKLTLDCLEPKQCTAIECLFFEPLPSRDYVKRLTNFIEHTRNYIIK